MLEQKHRVLYKHRLCKCYKVYEGNIELDTMQKAQKDKKTSFPKESVENVDLYKPVLNKIMTTHK